MAPTSYPVVSLVTDGVVENNVVYAVMSGDNVVTSNYEITYVYGTIQITTRRITLQTDGGSWTYDGLAHSAPNFDCVSGSVVDGQQIVATSDWLAVTTIADTGTRGVDNANTFAIFADEKDVSDNYAIVVVYGSLYIVPREITVCTENGMWVYDGQKHEHTYWSMEALTQGTLAEGQTIVVTVLGAVTNVWDTYEGNNVCEVTVFDGNGKPLAITEDDYEISETESENLANCRVEVVWLAEKFVDAGTITPDQINERAEVHVYDQDGNDITKQCVVDFVGSTLMIHKRSITITAVSESKIYDGTPLKATTFVVSSGELAEGDVLIVTSTAEITRPGVVVISIDDTNVEITRGENSARDNYEITYVDGILTVLEA